MIQKEQDQLFKVVLLGNSGVGKSSLFQRFFNDSFNDNNRVGLSSAFHERILSIDGKNIKIQLWDTAGQERYGALTGMYYKNVDGIIMVYDITNQDSFQKLDQQWMSDVEIHTEKKKPELLLIGNKTDLNESRMISNETGSQYALSKAMEFVETSAKTSDQVNAAFMILAKRLMKKLDLNQGPKQ